jgi:predicted Zn-dependent protease
MRALSILVSACLLIGCATSPTGRKQLMLVSDSQMNDMGLQAFQQLKQQTPIDKDSHDNAYVNCVVQPIIQAAQGQTSAKAWEVVVFADKQVNAFALPGGKIGVYQGLLPVAKTDAQLAAVLGHEVGHVIARHGAERMSEQLGEEAVLQTAGALTPDTTAGKAALGALGLGSQFGIALPHNRTQESEADLIGLDLMARAGFDPRQSIELWKNMTAAGGSQPPEWLSDHPANENRISDLQAHLPDALRRYQAAQAAGHHPSCGGPSQAPRPLAAS